MSAVWKVTIDGTPALETEDGREARHFYERHRADSRFGRGIYTGCAIVLLKDGVVYLEHLPENV